MEDDHSKGESGASNTFPKQCSTLRKGDHVVIKKHPCKIVEMSTSKTGKHGHAKVHMVAVDIFTQKKYEDICPSTHNMICPNVKRVEYQIAAVNEEDGYLTLMEDNGTTFEHLKVAGELLETAIKCEGDGYATVLSALDKEEVMEIKTKQQK